MVRKSGYYIKGLEFDFTPNGVYKWPEFNKNDINLRTNEPYSAWDIKRRINFANQFLSYFLKIALNPESSLEKSDYYAGLSSTSSTIA